MRKKTEEELQVRLARCQRARWLREDVLNVSRGHIARKYGIPISTMQTWEDVKLGGMVESGAQRLIKICKAEGVVVSVEWLMYGIGEPPGAMTFPTIKLSAEGIIAQELKLFYQLNKNAVHCLIQDDALAPWLMPGDYVAGRWHFDVEIKQALGIPSIVQLADGTMLVRVVREDELKQYHLYCTNPNTILGEKVIAHHELLNVAPIVWIRKAKYSGMF